MKIPVLLLKNISKLGKAGDVVMVAKGHYMNFLLPGGMGKRANAVEVARMEELKKKMVDERFSMLTAANELIEKIKAMGSLTIKVKVSEEGSLYGSVSAEDIAALATKTLGETVDAESVILAKPIKEAGEHTVTFSMGESKADVKLMVEAE